MKNKKQFVKQIITLFLIALFTTEFQSCKKKEETDPPVVEFTMTSPDTVKFEHSDTLQLLFGVQCNSDVQFTANLTAMDAAFNYINPDPLFGANQNGYFNIKFNQNFSSPGVYPCQLYVSAVNVNNVPQTKTVQLVYAPNCAYDYRNRVNGEITYQINGILLNETISCSYNELGQLEVTGLTTFTMVFNFDCASQTLTMVPVTHLGFYMTATGYVQGSDIIITMLADGNPDAVAKIKT